MLVWAEGLFVFVFWEFDIYITGVLYSKWFEVKALLGFSCKFVDILSKERTYELTVLIKVSLMLYIKTCIWNRFDAFSL